MDDNGHSEAILAVSITLLAISLLSVGLRCFVRTCVLHAFGWDDFFMVIAMVSYNRRLFENKVHMLISCSIDSVLGLLHLWNTRGQLWYWAKTSIFRVQSESLTSGVTGMFTAALFQKKKCKTKAPSLVLVDW
jgi:hypothetical protein